MNLREKIINLFLSRKNIDYHSFLWSKGVKNPEYKVKNFQDKLYNIDNQKREKFAILKLLSSHFDFLCNDTWKWFAVNIPLDLCGGTIKGDIDILVAMVRFKISQGKIVGEEVIYRVFEVKTTKIDKNGNFKSLKINKFEKIKQQLYKLINAGSQQTFLTEIFILEADYSKKFIKLPDFVASFIRDKVSKIKNEKFGYNCIILEQQRGFDEEKTGIFHMSMCLKGAEILKIENPIKCVVKQVEDFWEQEKTSAKGLAFIAYCEKCKKLNILCIDNQTHVCRYCKGTIFN